MVKIADIDTTREASVSYSGVIEKVEILRSMLRWASHLERPQIENLLNHCNTLRDEVLQLSHTERFVTATTRRRKQTVAQRREALIDRNFAFDGVFGESPKLLDAFEIAEKAAPTTLPVLIDGESGTGKELMAKVIHANGTRPDKPYISVNCGAIPDNLLESELFGHIKGAFTGASGNRSGRFESAHEGTIFLDEIGELPLLGQVKLLRVLQSNEIQRVGSDEIIKVDARIVAATNRNLKQMCDVGTFREDLYYRLSVIHITVPPLRERTDEIPLLIEFLGDEAARQIGRNPPKLSSGLRSFLGKYEYPGNIRELRNLIYRISCLAGASAGLEHLPEEIRPAGSKRKSGAADAALGSSLADVKKVASDSAEKEFLEIGLMETSGQVTELAKRIDMNRAHLQTLLKKHGISSKEFRRKPAVS